MNVIPRKLTRDGRPGKSGCCAKSSLAQTELLSPDELASKTFGKFDDASPNLLPCNVWQ